MKAHVHTYISDTSLVYIKYPCKKYKKYKQIISKSLCSHSERVVTRWQPLPPVTSEPT